MNRILLSLFFSLITIISIGQSSSIEITGVIVDSETQLGIPYATVVAVSSSTDKTIAGTTTGEDGSFELLSDSLNILVRVRFLGYNDTIISRINPINGQVDLGTVALVSTVQDLDGVKVTAEHSTMEFKLDKRVFNVGSDISSSGMGALEVLNNVPSVSVDIEGNISIRGNSGVQILIDGKPSVLSDDPANALGTLTADMIERIEIITNPSAKYEAGGTSGIINIVLKKDEKKGFNGSISLNSGWPHNHSIGGSLNYRTSKFNFFTQFGGGYRSRPDYRNAFNDNLMDSTLIESDGTNYRNEEFYNITIGTDYYINKYNSITLSGNFAYEIESQPSETEFKIFDASGNMTSNYSRIEETYAENPKWQYDLNYKKEFKNNNEHTLQFSTLGRFFGKDQRSEFSNEFHSGLMNAFDQRTATNFYQADYTFQLDYVNPLSKLWNLELGSMYNTNDVGNNYAVYDYDEFYSWQENANLTNNFKYVQKVLGVYGTASFEKEKFGLKLGVRGENTDLKTTLVNTNEENYRNYTNFFPTAHASYKFSKRFSMQTGYSRRIFRPRLWDLNPFFNIRNNFNIRTGNPNLMPEFADSYELTAILFLDKISLNGSIYHLYTTDVIENVSYFENNVNISTKLNVGTNKKTGFEFNGKYSPVKWLTVMADFNYGVFNREGSFEDKVFDFSGDQWSTKFNFKFKLPKDFDIEITPNYQSSVKTIQGNVSGFLYSDAGIRKKLWKGKAVVNFSVRDIFASRIRETIVDQETFYLYSYSTRGRMMTIGFSYSFGKGEAMTYSGGGHH